MTTTIETASSVVVDRADRIASIVKILPGCRSLEWRTNPPGHSNTEPLCFITLKLCGDCEINFGPYDTPQFSVAGVEDGPTSAFLASSLRSLVSGSEGKMVLQEGLRDDGSRLPNGDLIPRPALAIVKLLLNEDYTRDMDDLSGTAHRIEVESDSASRDLIGTLGARRRWRMIESFEYGDTVRAVFRTGPCVIDASLCMDSYTDEDFDGQLRAVIHTEPDKAKRDCLVQKIAAEARRALIEEACYLLGPVAKTLESEVIPQLRAHMVMNGHVSPSNSWESDAIQLPRLLAELRTLGLTPEQYAHLREEMDLTNNDIDELLERAETKWQTIKAAT